MEEHAHEERLEEEGDHSADDSLVLRGCEVLVPGIAFVDHIGEWRAQRIPSALAAPGEGRAVLVRYAERGPNVEREGVGWDTAGLVGDSYDEAAEWPFDETFLEC